jgi:hypothetical protein
MRLQPTSSRVLDRLGDLVTCEPPEDPPEPGLARQGQRAELVEAERCDPVETLQRRDAGKRALGERRVEVHATTPRLLLCPPRRSVVG